MRLLLRRLGGETYFGVIDLGIGVSIYFGFGDYFDFTDYFWLEMGLTFDDAAIADLVTLPIEGAGTVRVTN